MPTEAELRQRMHGEGVKPIDTAAVIRLARRRRLPRRIAVGTTVSLAVIGIGVAGISGIRGWGGIASSDSAGGFGESAGDAADSPDLCGTVPVASDPDAIGLAIRTDFPDTAPADGSVIAGSVTITNTGTTPIAGTTPLPSVAVLRDGIVVGYSGEPMPDIAAIVDLDPGESMRYDANLAATPCRADESGGSTMRPGGYRLSAMVTFTPDTVGRISPPTGSVPLTALGEPVTID